MAIAEVGALEGDHVVDAVADHRHVMAALVEGVVRASFCWGETRPKTVPSTAAWANSRSSREASCEPE